MTVRNYKKQDEGAVKEIFSQYWTDANYIAELIGELNTHVGEEGDHGTNKCRFYVAERDGELVGIAGFRVAPEYLRKEVGTENPAELYIIASKFQGVGIGNLLSQTVVREARDLYFTEIVCYSPETHNSSWKFYEKLGFTKHGIIKNPDDGYPGMLWKMNL